MGFGGVAFVASDLEGETGAVHEQSDDDLRVDPTFLRVPDFPQVIFLFGLEVQGRHVVQQQAQTVGFGGMDEALFGDAIPVLTGDDLLQVPFDRGVARRIRPEVLQDPAGVEFRARFDDPGDHQIPEHRVAEDPEAELFVDVGQHLAQQHRPGRFRPSRRIDLHGSGCGLEQGALPAGQGLFDRDLGRDAEVEGLLVGFEPGPGPFEQHAEFEVGVGGADVFDDLLPAAHVAGDLHGRGPGLGAHLPDKHHSPSLEPAPLDDMRGWAGASLTCERGLPAGNGPGR